MKEVTLKIPNDKYKFFIELVKQLGFEVENQQSEISEWQKKQLDKALEEHTSGKANYTDWQNIKNDLMNKYGGK